MSTKKIKLKSLQLKKLDSIMQRMNRSKIRKLITKKEPSPELREFIANQKDGQKMLADTLRVTKGTVWHWLNVTGVPDKYVFAVEAFTKNKITRYQIRPDLFFKGN